MSDALAREPQLAAVVRALDCLARELLYAALGALLERRKRLIDNSHHHQVLLPANGVECGAAFSVQFRDCAPDLRPCLAVTNTATFGDQDDRFASREGAKNLAALP